MDVKNKQHTSPWRRPWDVTRFNDLYNRDERYFSILVKGFLSWMNRNIVLYGKPINHFIFNTGNSVLYMENNGYDFSWNETTGNDEMYMHLPRCVVTLGNISIPTEELTQPYSSGYYERLTIEEKTNDDGTCQPWDRKISYTETIKGYHAEIRRLPIELTMTINYALSNMNETLILTQELIDKIMFQRYFNINYLGQVIQCSIEFPTDVGPQINKIDMTSTETNLKTIELSLKICSNYPIINTRTEIPADRVIERFNEGYKKESTSLVTQQMPMIGESIHDWSQINYNTITNTYTYYSPTYKIYSYYSSDNDEFWYWSRLSGATDWIEVEYIKETNTYVLYSKSLNKYAYYNPNVDSDMINSAKNYITFNPELCDWVVVAKIHGVWVLYSPSLNMKTIVNSNVTSLNVENYSISYKEIYNGTYITNTSKPVFMDAIVPGYIYDVEVGYSFRPEAFDPNNDKYIDRIDTKKFTYFDTSDNKFTDIKYEHNTYDYTTSYVATPYSKMFLSGISLYSGDPNKSSSVMTDHEDWKKMSFETTYKIN